MMIKIQSYKDLKVWQKAFDLTLLVYKTTDKFPDKEQYGITSQIRRSAISIPSNIAEGNARQGKKEYIQFLLISFSSGAELETQLLLAKELGYVDKDDYNILVDLLTEVMKMLNVLISRIKSST